MLWVVLALTAVAVMRGDTQFQGIVAAPPLAGSNLHANGYYGRALDLAFVSVIFAFLFVDIFDNSGTLLAVTQKAGLADADGNVERLGSALAADSLAAVAGAALGTSSNNQLCGKCRRCCCR
ncbi:MAG: solute carrier family 23 protein [Rheinheimera sp.]|nr:solute carrier family 23 protein [Rheinheimera sp.]